MSENCRKIVRSLAVRHLPPYEPRHRQFSELTCISLSIVRNRILSRVFNFSVTLSEKQKSLGGPSLIVLFSLYCKKSVKILDKIARCFFFLAVTKVTFYVAQVEFQFSLLTDTLYTPLPSFLAADVRYKCHSTVLAIEVKDMKNGASHYWSLAKLR